jgi:hypothetical protein
LKRRAKRDAGKLAVAGRLRRETMLTIGWIGVPVARGKVLLT